MRGVYIAASEIETCLGYGVEANHARMLACDVVDRDVCLVQNSCEAADLRLLAERLPACYESEYGRFPLGKMEDGDSGVKELSRLECKLLRCCEAVLEKGKVGLDERRKLGLIFASTKGNIDALGQPGAAHEEVSLTGTTERLAAQLGITGGVATVSQACISALSALILARKWLLCEGYEQVLVCAGDVLGAFICEGFASLKSLDSGQAKPFDINRKGLNLGEGVGAMLLSSAPVEYAPGFTFNIAGGATTNDANHLSAPSRTGKPLAVAITRAMEEAWVRADDLAFVSPHGTATLYNDEMESKAYALAHLSSVPAVGYKGFLGHTLGACGLVELALMLEAMKGGVIPRTYGFCKRGTPEPMGVLNQEQPVAGNAMLKTASGFGGCNAAVVVRHEQAHGGAVHGIWSEDGADSQDVNLSTVPPIVQSQNFTTIAAHKLEMLRRVRIASGEVWVDSEVVYSLADTAFPEFIRGAKIPDEGIGKRFGRMDEQCQLGVVVGQYLVKGYGKVLKPEETCVVLMNRHGSLNSDIKHQESVGLGRMGSPSTFLYTLPSTVLGELCVCFGWQGENIFLLENEPNGQAWQRAYRIVEQCPYASHAVVGWCDYLQGEYLAEFELLRLK